MNLVKFDHLVKKDRIAEKAEEADFLSLFGANSGQVSRFDKLAVILVVDESSSMLGQKDRCIEAVQRIEAEFPQAEFIKLTFSGQINRKDNFASYYPSGMTAMFDGILAGIAIGQAELSHDNVLHVTVTDGEENASKATLADTVAAVAEKKAKGWQFAAIWLQEQGQLGTSEKRNFDALGINLTQATDIKAAVEKLTDGLYGYLESGTLMLE
jgi:uncharacterized protein with von Willebrand factor type A (vWA) domain